MAHLNALITLDHVVKSFMNERDETDLHNFNRYKQIIIEGYSDMNIHYTTYIEQFVGRVNEVNQMALPSDCIDYIEVAVALNGKFWPLDINNDLIINKPDNCGNVVVFSEHFSAPSKKGFMYTARRRNVIGECKVDKRNRLIGFKGDFKGVDIYLSYISTGVEKQGQNYVEREYLPVLKSYLLWILTENDKTTSYGAKQRTEYLHGLQLEKLDLLQNNMTAHEFLSAIRDGYTQGIKR